MWYIAMCVILHFASELLQHLNQIKAAAKVKCVQQCYVEYVLTLTSAMDKMQRQKQCTYM